MLIILFFITYHVINIIFCHLFPRTARREVYITFDELLMSIYIDHLQDRCTIGTEDLFKHF
jgi:hypothetical protein